jgi:hypothetical protein
MTALQSILKALHDQNSTISKINAPVTLTVPATTCYRFDAASI